MPCHLYSLSRQGAQAVGMAKDISNPQPVPVTRLIPRPKSLALTWQQSAFPSGRAPQPNRHRQPALFACGRPPAIAPPSRAGKLDRRPITAYAGFLGEYTALHLAGVFS